MFIFKDDADLLAHCKNQADRAEKKAIAAPLKRDQQFYKGQVSAYRDVVDWLTDYIAGKEKQVEGQNE